MVINAFTAHAVSPRGLANNHEFCKELRIGHGLEPKIFWVRKSGQGLQRSRELAILQTLILMGDWCRQGGNRTPKETTGKGKKLVTQIVPLR
jgi:hypothetical protein